MEYNAIYEGDNLEVMSKFDSKSIDLIYADPPFFTNKQLKSFGMMEQKREPSKTDGKAE